MTELSQGSRRQQDAAARQYHREHYIERREQSPYAAAIKPRERVHAAVEFIHQNAADEKTRNDEEYIDTDEPAGQQTPVGVIEHNGNDRDRAQALNICAKLFMRRSYRVGVTSRRQDHRRTRIPLVRREERGYVLIEEFRVGGRSPGTGRMSPHGGNGDERAVRNERGF